MDFVEVIAIKALIVLAFAGGEIGGVMGGRGRYGDIVMALLGATLGAMILPLLGAAVVIAAYGVYFLFT